MLVDSPPSPRPPATKRRPLSSRLDDEWRSLAGRARVVARVRAWGLTHEPFADLDELLVLAGYRTPSPTPVSNDLLRRLVEVAHHDELAARIVLQRVMPGLLAVVRRRRRDWDTDGTLEELIGAAWLAIYAYRTDVRIERVASNLVRDAAYRAFTAPSRRLSSTEVATDPRTLDETPAIVVVSAAEELAGLMAEAREAGVDTGDLDLVRQLLDLESPMLVAVERKVTARTVRNHRDRVTRSLRQLAA